MLERVTEHEGSVAEGKGGVNRARNVNQRPRAYESPSLTNTVWDFRLLCQLQNTTVEREDLSVRL